MTNHFCRIHKKNSTTTVVQSKHRLLEDGLCEPENTLFVYDGSKWVLKNLDCMLLGKMGHHVHTEESHGSTGPMGPQGPDGLRGPMGPRGPIGENGKDGIGLRGVMGPEGPTGPMGIGQIGPSGDLGPTGPVGDLGPTGPVGIGQTGPMGDLGPTGPIGPTGPVGFIALEDNTFIGFDSGKYTTGSKNTFVGSHIASATGNSGNWNLFAGADAGHSNQDGSFNTYLGPSAGANNTHGSWNVFVGPSAGHSNQIGTNNVFIGSNAGISSIAGNSCICVGDNSDVSSEVPINQIVIGQGVIGTGDNTLTFPSNLKAMVHGTEVNFSNTNGGCLYPVSSTIRWKENVRDLGELVDTENLYKLRPVTFSGKENPDDLSLGLIAEEVNELFPVLVPKDSKNRPASVKYSLLSVLLLNEMKKLRQEVVDLQTKRI